MAKPETTARNVAAHILRIAKGRGVEITNLKLQKLLYYCQAWYLVIYDKPLFADRIEAWVHGPVIPPVFGDFKHLRWNPIDCIPPTSPISPGVLEHLDIIMNAYGDHSGTDLERLTHRELPWQIARAGLPADAPSTAIISQASMKAYYRQFSE